MKDISFDPLFERFSGNIYGSRKGDIRLALLTEYLNQQSLVCNGRRVADVGGGLGQFTRYFAERDAIVDYFDLSGRMCSHVTDQLIPDFPQQIKVHQGYFQEQLSQSYDIIFCNAVLEWLETQEVREPRHSRSGGRR